jgi:hypothetical protein
MTGLGADSGGYYILGGKDEHEPIPVDFLSWGQWFGEAGAARVVAQEQIGRYFVSTIFLGLNHNFASMLRQGGDCRPYLFETMIFLDGESGDCWRCATWEEAEAQHAAVLATVKALAG